MAVGTALAMGIGGALGGIGGLFGSETSQSSTSRVILDPATGREINAGAAVDKSFGELQGLVGAGPGMQDVQNSLGASRDLADMLKGGIDPTGDDINQSNSLAGALMAQQRTSATQNFAEAMRQGNSQASLMGRNANDPVLRAKLLQQQMNSNQMMDAQQFGLQSQLAMARPGQRIAQASNRANVLGGLASQAMANRQAIASMGDSIFQNERNFRLNTATKVNNVTQQSGGGVGGFINGALGGMGAGMGIAAGFGKGFGGGGGNTPTPSAPQYSLMPSAHQANPFDVSSGSDITKGIWG